MRRQRQTAVGGASPPPIGPDHPAGWRGRLPDAMPLLVVGAASFAVSYLLLHTAAGLGASHLPVWALFTASGAVVLGGGLAVIVAGGDEPEAPFETEDTVVLSRAEYERLREAAETAPDWVEPAPSSSPAAPPPEAAPAPARPSAPATAPGLAGAVGSEPPWSEASVQPRPEPAPATPPTEPLPIPTAAPDPAPEKVQPAPDPRPVLPPSVEETIREMTAALDSLVAPPNLPTRPGTKGSPPQEPGERSAIANPPSLGGLGPRTPRPRPRGLSSACTTCGSRIADVRGAPRCQVCEEPLCSTCRLRAEWEHHPELCARCHGLIALSENEE